MTGDAPIKLRDLLKIGDHVMHRGTKDWATILRIVPHSDGSAELELKRSPGGAYEPHVAAGWATYHLGAIEIESEDPRRARLARFMNIYETGEAGGPWPAPPKRT